MLKNYFSFLKEVTVPFYYASNFIKLLAGYYLKKNFYRPTDWLSLGNKLRFLAYRFIQLSSSLTRLKLEKKASFEDDRYLKILFYLKVQPEATEAYAETFCDDQSLIIDKLQNLSPPNTRIYIKEHPDDEKK